MPMIKDTPPVTSTRLKRIHIAAWALIYGGLLVLITGITVTQMQPANASTDWQTGDTLVLFGSLATALGAVLIYIRSRMQD